MLWGHCSRRAAVVALNNASGFERLVSLHLARLAGCCVDRLVGRLAARPVAFAVAAAVVAAVAAVFAAASAALAYEAVGSFATAVVRLQELPGMRSADAGMLRSVRRTS